MAILIGAFMIVGVILILLNPSTNNKALEVISTNETSAHDYLSFNFPWAIRKTSKEQRG